MCFFFGFWILDFEFSLSPCFIFPGITIPYLLVISFSLTSLNKLWTARVEGDRPL